MFFSASQLEILIVAASKDWGKNHSQAQGFN